MNQYELMVIFSPLLNDDTYKQAIRDYESFFSQHQAKIVHSDVWGLKSLAYPIHKKTTGFYWVAQYEAAPQFGALLRQKIRRDERVMRDLITVLDKHAVAYNEKKRSSKQRDFSPTQEG